METRFDEEHNLWAVHFVNSQGAEHVINWELASTPESRQLIVKFKQIEQYLEPPFIVESLPRAAKTAASAGKEDENEEASENDDADENLSASEKEEAEKPRRNPASQQSKERAKAPEIVEKNTARDLFDYVLNEGRKEYIVQRYKGLGEMTAEQLWETTMDPERRTCSAGKARRHRRVRNHLHHADGRRRGSPQQIHRRQRARREESGHLAYVIRLCGAGALARRR